MPVKKTTVRVHANPWHALNHEGIPQAAVQTPGVRGHYIGAAIDPVKSADTGKICFYFPPGAIEVPFGREVAQAVRDGALIAADLPSAKLCEVVRDAKDFVDPAKASAAAKASAIASWKAAYGEDLDPTTEPARAPLPHPDGPKPPAKDLSAGISLAAVKE